MSQNNEITEVDGKKFATFPLAAIYPFIGDSFGTFENDMRVPNLPEAKEIFNGQLTSDDFRDACDFVYLTLLTAKLSAVCLEALDNIGNPNPEEDIKLDLSEGEKSTHYKTLAGVSRSIKFLTEIDAPEFSSLLLQRVCHAMRESSLDDEFLVKLLMGIDPSKGLDREALIKGSRIYINRQLDAIN